MERLSMLKHVVYMEPLGFKGLHFWYAFFRNKKWLNLLGKTEVLGDFLNDSELVVFSFWGACLSFMLTTFYEIYSICRSKDLISRNVNPKTAVIKGFFQVFVNILGEGETNL
jgi:hypothetical protein